MCSALSSTDDDMIEFSNSLLTSDDTTLPQTRNSIKKKPFFFLLLLGLSFFPHCCSALTALILPCIFFSRRASLYCFPLHISAVTVPALCLSFYHLLTKNKQTKRESFYKIVSSDLQLSLSFRRIIVFLLHFLLYFFIGMRWPQSQTILSYWQKPGICCQIHSQEVSSSRNTQQQCK